MKHTSQRKTKKHYVMGEVLCWFLRYLLWLSPYEKCVKREENLTSHNLNRRKRRRLLI